MNTDVNCKDNCLRSFSSPELSYSLREKARKELNETPEVQVEALTDLRRRILSQCPTSEARTDSAYLIRFLRPKKYVVSKALTLYKNYHKIRRTHPEVFEELEPKHVQHVWKSCFVGGLPSKDREGRRIMVVSPQYWRPQEVSLKDALRSLICQLEYIIDDEETQINGIVLIADFSKFTFEQARSLRPTYIQLFVNLIQNAFPARFKGVYVLNQPWAFSLVMTLFRPFLSEKMKERIVMIGEDLSKLQDFIAPEDLPVDFGGSQSPYSGQGWADTILRWYGRTTQLLKSPSESDCSFLCSVGQMSEVDSVGSEVLGGNSIFEETFCKSSDESSDEFFDCEDVFFDSKNTFLSDPQKSISAPAPLKLETTV